MKVLTYLAMAVLSLFAAVEAGKPVIGPGGILLDGSTPPTPPRRYTKRQA